MNIDNRAARTIAGLTVGLALSACSSVRPMQDLPPAPTATTPVPTEPTVPTTPPPTTSSTLLRHIFTPVPANVAGTAVTVAPAAWGYRRFLEAAQAGAAEAQIRTDGTNARFANVRALRATGSVRTATTRNLEVHFIDVGQGDSTLILCPNGKTLLIDAGNLGNKEEVGKELRDYIHEQLPHTGARIDTVVITHPDKDHFNLLSEVLDGLAVGTIFHVGLYVADYGKRRGNEEIFGDWLASFPANKVKVLQESYFDKQERANPSIDCGDASVHVLAANTHGGASQKNARSIVLRLSYQGVDFILTGDATFETEEVILERYPKEWLHAEVLKLGHHGSLKTSSSQTWIEAIQPEISIASAGWSNTHGHPRQEVITRVEPYAREWTRHTMVAATGSKPYAWVEDAQYSKAVFNTAASSTVVVLVKPQGEFDVHWFEYE